MTALTAAPEATDGDRPERRRRWRKAAVIGGCIVLLAAAGAGLGFWRYAASYAPLRPGPFFGPYGSANHKIAQRETDLGNEFYIKGPAGTEAAVITGLANDGGHDVTVQSIPRTGAITKVEWSPYVVRPGGNVEGVALPLRPFPATVPAHGQIRVVITLRKLRCAGLIANMDGVLVQWHALGVDHTYTLPFVADLTYVGCPLHAH